MRTALGQHLEWIRLPHQRDIELGLGKLKMFHALAQKYFNADRE